MAFKPRIENYRVLGFITGFTDIVDAVARIATLGYYAPHTTLRVLLWNMRYEEDK